MTPLELLAYFETLQTFQGFQAFLPAFGLLGMLAIGGSMGASQGAATSAIRRQPVGSGALRGGVVGAGASALSHIGSSLSNSNTSQAADSASTLADVGQTSANTAGTASNVVPPPPPPPSFPSFDPSMLGGGEVGGPSANQPETMMSLMSGDNTIKDALGLSKNIEVLGQPPAAPKRQETKRNTLPGLNQPQNQTRQQPQPQLLGQQQLNPVAQLLMAIKQRQGLGQPQQQQRTF